jgi:hypothetical protein
MPRHEVTAYEVYPDGYDESAIVDKWRWRLMVTRMEQPDGRMLWVVTRGSYQRYTHILSSAGNWITDTPRMKRWTRHELDKALELAYAAVNEGPNGWTLQQWEDHFKEKETINA